MWSKNRVDSTPNTPAYSTTNTANLSAAYVSINYAYEEKTFFLEMVVYCTCAYRRAIFISINGNGEKIKWSDMILGNILPEPPADKGKVHDNTAKNLWVDINNLSDKQYNDYVEACKEKGFTIDAEASSFSYDAYNDKGYKLSLSHYGKNADMCIELEPPLEMSTIKWPTSTAGNMLPAPKSTTGKFSYEYEDRFFVYIGDTSKADYDEYINACSENGFSIDYSIGDNYYYADNVDGWHISLKYEGNNIMTLTISAPSEKEDNSISGTPSDEELDTSTKPQESEQQDDSSIDPDFKAAMDSYEKFIDEYIAFMKKYSENPSDLDLLSDYADYISKYTDCVKDFENWEKEEMNAAETAYYIEVQSRVSKKMLEVVQ